MYICEVEANEELDRIRGTIGREITQSYFEGDTNVIKADREN